MHKKFIVLVLLGTSSFCLSNEELKEKAQGFPKEIKALRFAKLNKLGLKLDMSCILSSRLNNEPPSPTLDRLNNEPPSPTLDRLNNEPPSPTLDRLNNEPPSPTLDRLNNEPPSPTLDRLNNEPPSPTLDRLNNEPPSPTLESSVFETCKDSYTLKRILMDIQEVSSESL